MGRKLCSSCNGTGSRVSTRSVVNTTQVGPTHQTVTESVPCGACGGSGGFWVPDPPPPFPRRPPKGSRRPTKSTPVRDVAGSPDSYAAGPSADEGDGAKQVFSIIGFVGVLAWIFEASPDPNPLLALAVATVGGILIGTFWKALVLIAILVLIVSTAGS